MSIPRKKPNSLTSAKWQSSLAPGARPKHSVKGKPRSTQLQGPTANLSRSSHWITFGPDPCDNELPAKSYYEEFEESLAEGSLEAERLSDVVSEEEAQEQRRLKADPARQYGMHLDGKLTLQTRRKFTSVEPANQEQLRAKYTVSQNMWLMEQLRQPGRRIFKDLTKTTFDDHLRLLLNRRNFNYRKDVDGQNIRFPLSFLFFFVPLHFLHCAPKNKTSRRRSFAIAK